MAKKIGFSDLESKFEKLLTPFQSTNEIIPLQEMIGQNRAVKAVEFGLSVKKTGYNVFVSGAPGTGKITYIKNYTNRLAKKKKPPRTGFMFITSIWPINRWPSTFPRGRVEISARKWTS